MLYTLSTAYDSSESDGHFAYKSSTDLMSISLPQTISCCDAKCKSSPVTLVSGKAAEGIQENINKSSLKGLEAQCCRKKEQKVWKHTRLNHSIPLRGISQRTPCMSMVQNTEEWSILIITFWATSTSFPLPHICTQCYMSLARFAHIMCQHEQ